MNITIKLIENTRNLGTITSSTAQGSGKKHQNESEAWKKGGTKIGELSMNNQVPNLPYNSYRARFY